MNIFQHSNFQVSKVNHSTLIFSSTSNYKNSDPPWAQDPTLDRAFFVPLLVPPL